MAPMQSDLPRLIVEAVRERVGAVRALRTKWALLARDLLALATGVRFAVMLDYITLQPEILLGLVQRVAGLRLEAGPAHTWTPLSIQGVSKEMSKHHIAVLALTTPIPWAEA